MSHAPFVVRRGLNRTTGFIAVFLVLMLGFMAWAALHPTELRGGPDHPVIVTVGASFLAVLIAFVLVINLRVMVLRRLELQVDARGITFGHPTKPTEEFVPWADIQAIVVWEEKGGYARRDVYIGLIRRPGAPPLTLLTRRPVQGVNLVVAGHAPGNLTADAFLKSIAPLHITRFGTAVANFAPGLPFTSVAKTVVK